MIFQLPGSAFTTLFECPGRRSANTLPSFMTIWMFFLSCRQADVSEGVAGHGDQIRQLAGLEVPEVLVELDRLAALR